MALVRAGLDVVKDTATFTFADHVEEYQAGDAFYLPPGHSPAHSADSELVLRGEWQ